MSVRINEETDAKGNVIARDVEIDLSKPTIERWILVEVGCIECGEDSRVIGAYETQREAEDDAVRNGLDYQESRCLIQKVNVPV